MGFVTVERQFESGDNLLLQCRSCKSPVLKPQSREHKLRLAASPLYPPLGTLLLLAPPAFASPATPPAQL